MFIAALVTIVRIWKQPKCSSTDNCYKMLDFKYMYIYIYIYVRQRQILYYFSVKSNKICQISLFTS